MQREHRLHNQGKVQHEVMVILAPNVEYKAATDHIKTELAHQMAQLLAPLCIVIKSPTIITILQFYASHIGIICLADIAFQGNMGIYSIFLHMVNAVHHCQRRSARLALIFERTPDK